MLSPFLFLLAIDWTMKESTTNRRNGIQRTLTDSIKLKYGDVEDVIQFIYFGSQVNTIGGIEMITKSESVKKELP